MDITLHYQREEQTIIPFKLQVDMIGTNALVEINIHYNGSLTAPEMSRNYLRLQKEFVGRVIELH